MKYQKIFISIIIFISIVLFFVSFKIRQRAVQIGEQTTQITSDVLLKILNYQNIANILCAAAIVLLCLLPFAYQIFKKQWKREE